MVAVTRVLRWLLDTTSSRPNRLPLTYYLAPRVIDWPMVKETDTCSSTCYRPSRRAAQPPLCGAKMPMDGAKAILVVVVVGEGPREETSEGHSKSIKCYRAPQKQMGGFELYLGQMLCGGETSGLIRGWGGDNSSKWTGNAVRIN